MSAAAALPLKPARHMYFVNRWVDFLFIGGLSLLTFAAFWLARRFASDGSFSTLDRHVSVVAGMLVWLINWPHFSATSYRLYHSRENIRQYPITALVIPILIMAALVGSFASPKGIAPYFVKLYYLWSPYHFSGQTIGISLLYARRAGFLVGSWQRFAFAGFIFGTFFMANARAESGPGPQYDQAVEIPVMNLPAWVGDWAEYGMWAGGIGFALYVAGWSWRSRRMLPLIVLLPAVSQAVWFLPYWYNSAFSHLVPMFHSLQYLLIAWAMQLKERMDENGFAPSALFAVRESVVWAAINFLGGAFLFFLLPLLCSWCGYRLDFTTPVVLAAVQLHHFFVDGVIWKLKNPKVGSPLMVNIEDLVKPRPVPAGQPA